MEQRVGVVEAEPVAPVIALAPELRDAADQLHLAGVGADAEVLALEVELLAGLLRRDDARAPAVGAINPSVEPPAQAVDAELGVAFLEAGEENVGLVGLAVGVGVAGEEDVGGGGDQDAVAP